MGTKRRTRDDGALRERRGAAAILGISDGRLRQLALGGQFVETARLGNRRVYLRRDVERYKRVRAKGAHEKGCQRWRRKNETS